MIIGVYRIFIRTNCNKFFTFTIHQMTIIHTTQYIQYTQYFYVYIVSKIYVKIKN
jgi:hypothetical protein